MSTVLKFPARPDHLRKKSELASYLRTMADYVESDAIALGPVAILMVLTSEHHHEVLNIGYDGAQGLFSDAAKTAFYHASSGYKKQEGHTYDRWSCMNSHKPGAP